MDETLWILLIEDNPGDAELIRVILEGLVAPRYLTHNVQRLSAALALLQQEHFDIIILDLGLPDSSGLDTLKAAIHLRNSELQVRAILDAIDNQVLLMGTDHRIKSPIRESCPRAPLSPETLHQREAGPEGTRSAATETS